MCLPSNLNSLSALKTSTLCNSVSARFSRSLHFICYQTKPFYGKIISKRKIMNSWNKNFVQNKFVGDGSINNVGSALERTFRSETYKPFPQNLFTKICELLPFVKLKLSASRIHVPSLKFSRKGKSSPLPWNVMLDSSCAALPLLKHWSRMEKAQEGKTSLKYKLSVSRSHIK